MSNRSKKDTLLCENFCRYYKPGKNEDLTCQGYVVVQSVIGRGKALSRERPLRMRRPDARSVRALEVQVCGHCAFRAEDCDYIATGGAAPSCGGLLLLMHLVGSGELTLEEIEHDPTPER